MAEKTEKPTDKKRRDSAKKGQTFKSKDLVTTLILIGGVCYLASSLSFRPFISLYVMTLLYNQDMNVTQFLVGLMWVFFQLSLPFIVLCSIIGIVVSLLQTQFAVASEALKINFKALNPIEGFKKIFSLRTIKELVKSVLYLAVLVVTCYTLFYQEIRNVISVYHGSVSQLIAAWSFLTVKTVMVFMAWSLLILIVEFMAEYYLHFKMMKMDKHEVKQERKEIDGNPEIKRARRRVHQEILSGEEKAAIRSSEVILANPTHIAIALYFNPDVAMLPFIALRCTNLKAKVAIAYARKSGVPVVHYVVLARRLYANYSNYSFISLNDEALMEVMDVLIWLRKVEYSEMQSQEEVNQELDVDINDGETEEKIRYTSYDCQGKE